MRYLLAALVAAFLMPSTALARAVPCYDKADALDRIAKRGFVPAAQANSEFRERPITVWVSWSNQKWLVTTPGHSPDLLCVLDFGDGFTVDVTPPRAEPGSPT